MLVTAALVVLYGAAFIYMHTVGPCLIEVRNATAAPIRFRASVGDFDSGIRSLEPAVAHGFTSRLPVAPTSRFLVRQVERTSVHHAQRAISVAIHNGTL
jgi:hypothetical protein